MTIRRASFLACLGLLASACSCSDDPGANPDGSTIPGPDGSMIGMDGAVGPDGTVPPPPTGDGGPVVRADGSVVITEDGGFTWECVPVVCAGNATECGDCLDNDGDGFVDSRDRECLGPCDNTEGPALTTGVGGETGASCNRDCYFDFGNGHGNDTCRWDTLCDPNSPDERCPYDESQVGGMRCPDTQTALCLDVCRPLTPNGCDCFGCCFFDELAGRPDSEGGEYVWLGSGIGEGTSGDGTCTFDLIDDPSACHPCEPVADCFNDCGRCELCLGRETLPPDCLTPPPDASVPDGGAYDGGTPELRCDPGVQACGLPSDPDCPTDYYCVTGCCQPTLI